MGSARRIRALLFAALAAFACGCGGPSPAEEALLAELEQLAFVPAFSVRLPPIQPSGELCAVSEALLVDRYEVPRARWLAWQATAVVDAELSSRTAAWMDDTAAWPATWIDRDEARDFARSRGMRLPTAGEWLAVAAGPRALPFPWGASRASLVANTAELGLSRPLPVGTFELGATPFGTYEMRGNVWEWVEDALPQGSLDGERTGLAWVLGGSFASTLVPLFDVDEYGRARFASLAIDARTRGDDIGVRCVVEARAWLVAHAGSFGTDDETQARLVSIGRRFGRDAVPLLEELVRSVPRPRALGWLLAGASS